MPIPEYKCQSQNTMCRKAEEKKLGPGALMIENMKKQGKPVTPWVEKLAASMDKMQKEGGEMGEVYPLYILSLYLIALNPITKTYSLHLKVTILFSFSMVQYPLVYCGITCQFMSLSWLWKPSGICLEQIHFIQLCQPLQSMS